MRRSRGWLGILPWKGWEGPLKRMNDLAGIWLSDTPLSEWEREGGRVRDSTDWASEPLLILTQDI